MSALETWQREDGLRSYLEAIAAIRRQVASGAAVPTDGYFRTSVRFAPDGTPRR